MGTSATIKVEDRNTGFVRRLWVAHDGDRMKPCIERAVLTGSDVDEITDTLQRVIATDIYGGKVPNPRCIQALYDYEASLNAYADYRYRVLVSDGKAKIFSSADLV